MRSGNDYNHSPNYTWDWRQRKGLKTYVENSVLLKIYDLGMHFE